jgi:hypothetical protein
MIILNSNGELIVCTPTNVASVRLALWMLLGEGKECQLTEVRVARPKTVVYQP